MTRFLSYVLRGALVLVLATTAVQARESKPPTAAKESRSPKISSQPLDVEKCPTEGAEGTRRCQAPGGYAVIETKTALSDFRMVVSEGESFQAFLEPSECAHSKHIGNLEWRSFDAKPFAVIQHVECFKDAIDGQDDAGKSGKPAKADASYLVVKGLRGFEGLSRTVRVRGTQAGGAREQARRLADGFLKQQWPRLEKERLEAEKAEASDEDEDEDEGDTPADGQAPKLDAPTK